MCNSAIVYICNFDQLDLLAKLILSPASVGGVQWCRMAVSVAVDNNAPLTSWEAYDVVHAADKHLQSAPI